MSSFQKKFYTFTGQEATMSVKSFVFVFMLCLANVASADGNFTPEVDLPTMGEVGGVTVAPPACKLSHKDKSSYRYDCVAVTTTGEQLKFKLYMPKPKDGRAGKGGKTFTVKPFEKGGWQGAIISVPGERPVEIYGMSVGAPPDAKRLAKAFKALGIDWVTPKQLVETEDHLKGLIGDLKRDVEANRVKIEEHGKRLDMIEEGVVEHHREIGAIKARVELQDEVPPQLRRSGDAHDHREPPRFAPSFGEKSPATGGVQPGLGFMLRIGRLTANGLGAFYRTPIGTNGYFFQPGVTVGYVNNDDGSSLGFQTSLALGRKFSADWAGMVFVQTTGTPWKPTHIDFPGIAMEYQVNKMVSLGALGSLVAMQTNEYSLDPKGAWTAGVYATLRLPK